MRKEAFTRKSSVVTFAYLWEGREIAVFVYVITNESSMLNDSNVAPILCMGNFICLLLFYVLAPFKVSQDGCMLLILQRGVSG